MDAFLSYRRKDAALAHRLAADLERSGVTVWSSHEAIRPGQEWARETEKAISEARNVLIIVSNQTKHAVSGQSSEIALAVASQRSDPSKRIVPILASRTTELPFFLRRYYALDLSSDSAYEQALPQLVRLLREPPPPESFANSDEAMSASISVQRESLLCEQAQLIEEARASHTSLVAVMVGTIVTILVIGVFTLSVIHLGWLGERSVATFLAYLFGVLVGLVGLGLVRWLSDFFSSLFGGDR